MRKIDRLKQVAMAACKFRRHKMSRWAYYSYGGSARIAESGCKRCGMMVHCDTKPLPNGIEIGGEAVALTCEAVALTCR